MGDWSTSRGWWRVRGPRVTGAQLNSLRKDTRSLTDAVEGLSARLEQTATRVEVTEEIDGHLLVLEKASVGALQGAKNQSARTRRAGWVLLGLLLVFASLINAQLHDVYTTQCLLDPDAPATTTYVCDALFPLSSHEGVELLHEGLITVRNGDASAHVRYTYTVPPQAVGGVFYALLLGGTLVGLLRYRRRAREERDVMEVGGVTPEGLDAFRSQGPQDPTKDGSP